MLQHGSSSRCTMMDRILFKLSNLHRTATIWRWLHATSASMFIRLPMNTGSLTRSDGAPGTALLLQQSVSRSLSLSPLVSQSNLFILIKTDWDKSNTYIQTVTDNHEHYFWNAT